jgi:hypothetical protein
MTKTPKRPRDFSQAAKLVVDIAAGVTKRLWEIADIVDVLEAWEVEREKGYGAGKEC